jgi:hypothetical protein
MILWNLLPVFRNYAQDGELTDVHKRVNLISDTADGMDSFSKELKMKRILILGLIIITGAGCLPQSPTMDPVAQGVIATKVAATMTAAVVQENSPPQSGQTAEPAAPTDTLEPGVTAAPTETPTLTLTPTETLTPTASLTPTLGSGDPVLALGSPTFDDRFDGGPNFYLYDDNQASYQIEDDRMVLTAKKANSYETWSLAWGDLKNFYLEVTGSFGEDCGGKDRYGLIFRAPDTSEGYLISLTCDGSFRLSTWESDAEEYTSLKPWTASPHINTGPGATNRLGIRAKNSKLTGFINGNQVFELNDDTFNEGRFGVIVAASETPGFKAYLDRVVYWKLP